MKRLIIGCFILIMFNQQVFARDFEGGYAVYGAGADSCKAYLDSMKAGGRQQDYFIDWTIGYLTAFNVIMPNTYNILGESEFAETQGWLQRHCNRYPKQLYINALIKLTEVLYPLRYQSGMKKPAAQLKDVGKAVK
ncbi:MAG: hypothetical protein OQK98_15080 [Gammaproteobacteria bacterium]|nr:hypothetical protein [Gammaproteobacteria bacterium]